MFTVTHAIKVGRQDGLLVELVCVCLPFQDCLARTICSDAIRNLTQVVKAKCGSSGACGSSSSFCDVQPVVPGNFRADVAVYVRTHNPFTTGSDSSFVPPYANPPVSSAFADWASSRYVIGSKVMALWSGNGFDGSSEALLIGAVVGGQRVILDMSATPLTGAPVVVSGSGALTNGVLTFTATELIEGGAILNLTLVCDLFQDPTAALQVLALEGSRAANETFVEGTEAIATTLAEAQYLGTRGANLLLAGITSATDTGAFGWNEYVKPALLLSNASFVQFQMGQTVAIITLPPLPLYAPSGSEQLVVTVPDFMLASGSKIALPGVSATVVSPRQDCVVAEWGPWSPCSLSCATGTQIRTRPIVAAPANGGLPCVPTTASRSCNTCDPCIGISCGTNGLCASGACVCQPGWTGPACTLPAFSLNGTALGVVVSQWGACSATCGPYGTRRRTVACVQLSSTGSVTLPLSICAAAGLIVNGTAPCNAISCDTSSSVVEATAVLAANIPVGTATAEAALWEAVASALAEEVAAAATISPSGVQVTAFSSGPSGTVAHFSILSLPGVGVAPISAAETLQSKLTSGSLGGTYASLIVPASFTWTAVDANGATLASGTVTSGTVKHGNSSTLPAGWIATIVLVGVLLVTNIASLVYFKARAGRKIQGRAAIAVPLSKVPVWHPNPIPKQREQVQSNPPAGPALE